MGPLKTDRLRLTLNCLKTTGNIGATTLDLQLYTGSMAVGSDVADLRKKGYKIKCKYVGLTDSKRKIYNYSMGEN